jgi:hypothetical protein
MTLYEALKKTLEDDDIEGSYRIDVSAGDVEIQEIDKVREYIEALNERLCHSGNWIVWLGMLAYPLAILFLNTNLSDSMIPIHFLRGWLPGIILFVLGFTAMMIYSNVKVKSKAVQLAEEYKQKAAQLNFRNDELLSQEWVDKKAASVKNMILAEVLRD